MIAFLYWGGFAIILLAIWANIFIDADSLPIPEEQFSHIVIIIALIGALILAGVSPFKYMKHEQEIKQQQIFNLKMAQNSTNF